MGGGCRLVARGSRWPAAVDRWRSAELAQVERRVLLATDEPLQPSLQQAARQQDPPIALDAAQTDIRTEADHLKIGVAAGVLLAKAQHIAKLQADRLLGHWMASYRTLAVLDA
jgi:hypothetical protein